LTSNVVALVIVVGIPLANAQGPRRGRPTLPEQAQTPCLPEQAQVRSLPEQAASIPCLPEQAQVPSLPEQGRNSSTPVVSTASALVPEPTTITMLALGAAGLLMNVHRRRRNKS
jgi:hypothetical protein